MSTPLLDTAGHPATDHPLIRRFTAACGELVTAFERDGYVLLADALSAEQVAAVNDEAVRLCRGEFGEIMDRDPDPASAAESDILPRPAVPLEELEGLSDGDVLRRFLCIHQPHKISPVAREVVVEPRIVEVLTRVIGANIKSMQSMLFIKSEGKPGQPWHQDEYFIPTRDRSLTAVWIALDDATVENGCLWVLPGSHRRGVLYPDRDQDDPSFDCSIEAFDFPHTENEAVPVEIPAGTAVIFNGYLLHRSLQNSGVHGFRRSLATHYMSAESLLPWKDAPEDVHIGKHDFRDIIMVAGEDPYAYKGIVDVVKAHTRPDKDGGCDR